MKQEKKQEAGKKEEKERGKKGEKWRFLMQSGALR